jgi:hypothetical protein
MTSAVSKKSSAQNYFQELDPEMMLDLLTTQFQNIDEKKGLQGGGSSAPAGGTPAAGTAAAPDTRTAQGARAVNNAATDGMAHGTRDATRPGGEVPSAVRRGIEKKDVAPAMATAETNTGTTTT